MTDKITIKLVETNFYTRWPCHVCGGNTEKVGILAEAKDKHGTIRVCEGCLEAGDIDARLARYATTLAGQADLVRDLIGRLEVPTYAEWLDACDRHDKEVQAAYEKEGYVFAETGATAEAGDDDGIPF